MQKIIEKAEKIVALGKEYLEAVKYESALYHLVFVERQFMVFRISDQQNVCTGDMARIKSYCRLRSIDTAKVYADLNVLQELKNRKIEFYGKSSS